MRKHWKLITLVILMLVTLGVFYTHSSLAALKYPEFKIKTLSGDESEIENSVLYASLVDNEENVFAEITSKGTDYLGNYSYLDSLLMWDESTEVKRLQKEYRKFMRGKNGYLNQIYEDENVLAYVEMKMDYSNTGNYQLTYSFYVDVLDKATNQSRTFTVPVPENQNYNYVQVHQIQVMEGQVKVVTVNDLVRSVSEAGYDSYHDEIHLYSINIKNEELVRDDILLDLPKKDNTSFGIDVLDRENESGVGDYIAYHVQSTELGLVDETDGSYEAGMTESRLFLYNLKTMEQKEVNMPSGYDEELYPELLSAEYIYFSQDIEDQLDLIQYNFNTDEVEEQYVFELLNSGETSQSNYAIMNEKIYLMNQPVIGEVATDVKVADIKTGDVLYEGVVEISKANKNNKLYEIHMDYLAGD